MACLLSVILEPIFAKFLSIKGFLTYPSVVLKHL